MLHHWMERHRPMVFALSDGSGSLGVARAERSRHVIEASGATTGPVFGLLPDADWYRAIVAQDIAPFMGVIEAMTASGTEAPFAVVSDSDRILQPFA